MSIFQKIIISTGTIVIFITMNKISSRSNIYRSVDRPFVPYYYIQGKRTLQKCGQALLQGSNVNLQKGTNSLYAKKKRFNTFVSNLCFYYGAGDGI